MRDLFVIALIFAISYAVSRPIFSTAWPLLGVRWLFLSGTELVLVGHVCGPHGLALLPQTVVDALGPVLHLTVGWAGLLFGLQFSRPALRAYPRERYLLAFVQVLVAGALCVAGALWLLPRVLGELSRNELLFGAALVGICCAGTSPTSLHYVSVVLRVSGRVNRLLRFIAAVDGIPPVLALGLVVGLARGEVTAGRVMLPGWSWWLIATALGILLGFLLTWLVELEFSRDELLLFVLGMVVVAGGLAYTLQLSAVYVNFVLGLTVARVAWHREEVQRFAGHVEKPIYLTLLFLAGTTLVLDDVRVFVLALALVALRFIAKVVGNLYWPAVVSEPAAQTPLLGVALLSQGGMALVMAVDVLALARETGEGSGLLTILTSGILVALLINELASPIFLRLLFGPRSPRSSPAQEAPG